MDYIKAPNKISPAADDSKYLFLAGSIETGTAEMWQEQVCNQLRNTNWTILNPYRADWDDSWVESKDDLKFRGQVEWELNAQEMQAATILMYLAPGTDSPVSMLELGLFARTGRMLVVCPEGFPRKGNVDIVCERYGVTQYDSIDNALEDLSKSTP